MLIGISGHKQAGKDTLTDGMVSRGFGKKYMFADKLKQVCVHLFNLDPNILYGTGTQKELPTDIKWSYIGSKIKELRMPPDAHEDYFLTHRQVLQILGSDVLREFFPNIWIHSLFSTIQKDEQLGHSFSIISDVRFPNEVEAIKSQGGIVVRLLRNSDGGDVHPSETILDKNIGMFDIIIDNRNTTIEQTYKMFENKMKELKIFKE